MIFIIAVWLSGLYVMITCMHASLNSKQSLRYFEQYICEDDALFKKHKGDMEAYIRESRHLYLAYIKLSKGVFRDV